MTIPPLARVFDQVAGVYEESRPSYPPAALELLDLGRGRQVLDLGAGTGKLTRLLVGARADEEPRELARPRAQIENLPSPAQVQELQRRRRVGGTRFLVDACDLVEDAR